MHAERRREPRRAGCRQRVVRPGRVIAERNGRVGADEDRAGVLHLRREPRRVVRDNEQVLGREVVRDVHRLRHVVSDHDAAVGRADDVGALQAVDQRLELVLDPVREGRRIGHQHAPRKRVMLELRRQVGGDEVGARRAIGDDHHLGRTRDAVEADRTEDLALRERHVDVSGPRDHVDARDGRGAVRQRCDRLRAADAVYAVDAGDARRGEDRRRHGAVRAGRRGQHHLGHARYARRDHGHQHGRGIRRAPARRVDARAPHGPREQLQPGRAAGRLRHLPGVELADPLGGELERGAVRGRQAPDGRRDVVLGHGEVLAQRRRPAVEPLAELAQRCVALSRHARADLLHRRALFRKLRQVEAPPRQRRVEPRADVEAPNRHRSPPPSAARRAPARPRSAS